MKNLSSIILTLFSFSLFSQNIQENIYSGIISIKNGKPIAYEINLTQEKGIVNSDFLLRIKEVK